MKQIVLDAIRTHKEHIDALESSCVETTIAAAEIIIETIRNDGCVFICGNGGSAADAQHIAGELVGRFRRERRALPAVALTTDSSVMTAVGNDYSFADVFSRQVEALVGAKDLLWAFSTSGASENVAAACKLARRLGAKILAFTGKAGSPLEEMADLCLCVDAPATSTAQEVHQLAYHIICDLVEREFCEG